MNEVEEYEFKEAWTKRFEDDPLGALEGVHAMLQPDDPENQAFMLRLVKRFFSVANAEAKARDGKSIFEIVLPPNAKRLRRAAKLGYNEPGSFWRQWPYCLASLEGGGWLPLGRQYKPIGQPQVGFYNYEAYAGQGWHFDCDPRKNSDVRYDGSGHSYLYREGEMYRLRDFENYLGRLGRLLGATGDNGLVYMMRLLRSLPD